MVAMVAGSMDMVRRVEALICIPGSLLHARASQLQDQAGPRTTVGDDTNDTVAPLRVVRKAGGEHVTE